METVYDQTTNMNRHGVVLGRILDFQLSSLPGTCDQKERLQSEQAMSKEVTVDDVFSSNSYININ